MLFRGGAMFHMEERTLPRYRTTGSSAQSVLSHVPNMHRAGAVVSIQLIERAHEPGLACLVACVEQVAPVIRGRREIHQHHTALLVVKPRPIKAFEQRHGGADKVRSVSSGIRQAHGGMVAIKRPRRRKPVGHHEHRNMRCHQVLTAEFLPGMSANHVHGFERFNVQKLLSLLSTSRVEYSHISMTREAPISCRTIRLMAILALALLMAPLAVGAQQPSGKRRIAVLGLNSAPPASALPPVVAAFHQRLGELGWVEGQNLTIEWRWAEGRLDRFATLVEEMVRLPVEVLVVPNQTTAGVAQKATTTIPIVIMAGGDLAQSAPSLAQPGGNVTRMANLNTELSTKRLELLTHMIPGLTRVAVLRGLASQTLTLQAMEVAARALGVQLQVLQARDAPEIDQAFAAAVREGAGALMAFGDGGSFVPYAAKIADLALTHRLPSAFTGRGFVEAGGLMSYASSPSERGQRVAVYVDKILKGAKPGDLPIEQSTTFEFVINLKTAQALGLTIPPVVLFQATEVIR
jgi:putative tryptophan/tyrosine transport system substrate-binding protein